MSKMLENNCPDQVLIQEYLDEPTSESVKAKLDAHIVGCDSCKKDLEQYEEFFSLVKSSFKLPEVQPTKLQLEKIRSVIPVRKETSAVKWFDFEAISSFFNSRFVYMAASISIVFILFFVTLKKDVGIKKTFSGERKVFNLAKNDTSLIYCAGKKECLVDAKVETVTSIKAIVPEKKYKLPGDCIVMMHSQGNRIQLSQAPEFKVSGRMFELIHGKGEFHMEGPHKGFRVKTPLAEISTIGTVFEVQSSQDFLKIKLLSGELVVKTISNAIQKIEEPQTVFVEPDGSFSASQAEDGVATTDSVSTTVPVSDLNQDNASDSGKKLEDSF